MTPGRKNLIGECDGLIKEITMKLNRGICMRCKGVATDPAHIIRRRFLRHRWRVFNVLAFCPICHKWFDEHTTKEERLEWLKANAHTHYEYVTAATGDGEGTFSTTEIKETRVLLKSILRLIAG